MLDVKKSSIHFSEDLLDKIGDQIKPLRATSKNAWSKLSKEYNNRLAEQRNSEQREKVLEGLEGPYEKIPVDLPSDEKKKREKTLEEAYSNEQIVDIESDQETGKPEQRPSDKQTIEYVPALESDQIYRPYQVEGQVRINISRGHKFQQFLSDYLEEIPYEVQQAVEILFLSLAYAEVSVARNFTHQDFSDQEKLSRLLIEILNEFRHDFSTNLSKNTSRIARLLAEDT